MHDKSCQPCSFIVLSHPHTCLCGFCRFVKRIPTSPNIVNVLSLVVASYEKEFDLSHNQDN